MFVNSPLPFDVTPQISDCLANLNSNIFLLSLVRLLYIYIYFFFLNNCFPALTIHILPQGEKQINVELTFSSIRYCSLPHSACGGCSLLPSNISYVYFVLSLRNWSNIIYFVMADITFSKVGYAYFIY